MRCEVSWRAESSTVTAVTGPPLAEMRCTALPGVGTNRMSPFFPQAPPRLHWMSHSFTGRPSPTGTFIRLAGSPVVKKPIQRLSGDQNGWSARSVSGIMRAAGESSARTHRCQTCPESTPT